VYFGIGSDFYGFFDLLGSSPAEGGKEGNCVFLAMKITILF
jgi:hypothetical protein